MGKICRANADVAKFFGLPDHIRQEDSSRGLLEAWFQQVDANDDREISWEEFCNFYTRGSSSRQSSQQGELHALKDSKAATVASKAAPSPNATVPMPTSANGAASRPSSAASVGQR